MLVVGVNPAILSIADCARLFHVSSPEKAARFEEWAKTAAPGTVWSQWLYEREWGSGGIRGTAVMLADDVQADMEL